MLKKPRKTAGCFVVSDEMRNGQINRTKTAVHRRSFHKKKELSNAKLRVPGRCEVIDSGTQFSHVAGNTIFVVNHAMKIMLRPGDALPEDRSGDAGVLQAG